MSQFSLGFLLFMFEKSLYFTGFNCGDVPITQSQPFVRIAVYAARDFQVVEPQFREANGAGGLWPLWLRSADVSYRRR
jgi:hypothetical protein